MVALRPTGFLSACDQTLQIVLRAAHLHAQTLLYAALSRAGFISGHGLSMDWGPIGGGYSFICLQG
jgi:hypothetical protein